MTVLYLVDIIPFLVIISAIYFGLFYYCKYLTLKKELKTKYIKIDVRVKDAFYEAYLSAKKKHNDFEAKTFNNLFLESQGKQL